LTGRRRVRSEECNLFDVDGDPFERHVPMSVDSQITNSANHRNHSALPGEGGFLAEAAIRVREKANVASNPLLARYPLTDVDQEFSITLLGASLRCHIKHAYTERRRAKHTVPDIAIRGGVGLKAASSGMGCSLG
jgi:hypothetical protein